jgi:hypothetical protein
MYAGPLATRRAEAKAHDKRKMRYGVSGGASGPYRRVTPLRLGAYTAPLTLPALLRCLPRSVAGTMLPVLGALFKRSPVSCVLVD